MMMTTQTQSCTSLSPSPAALPLLSVYSTPWWARWVVKQIVKALCWKSSILFYKFSFLCCSVWASDFKSHMFCFLNNSVIVRCAFNWKAQFTWKIIIFKAYPFRVVNIMNIPDFAAWVNRKSFGLWSDMFQEMRCFGISSKQRLVNEMAHYIDHICLPTLLTSKGKLPASLLILSIMNLTFKSLIRSVNKVSVEG